jgi:hypothetical protein
MYTESLKPMPSPALQERSASHEPEFESSARRPSRLDLNRMFEENEILTQIKALRQEVGTRLDDMDQRLRKIEADIASPAIQGFGARLEEMDERLRRVESEYQPIAAVLSPGAGISALAARQDYVPAAPAAPTVPTSTVVVTINPLFDVSRVRVVEGALIAIDGVEAVTLQTLSGNTAELQVQVQENVSLIGGLRRTLPLAFDVSASEDASFTIALAESVPVPRQDDVIVQKLP